jgi:hypothetical protein
VKIKTQQILVAENRIKMKRKNLHLNSRNEKYFGENFQSSCLASFQGLLNCYAVLDDHSKCKESD